MTGVHVTGVRLHLLIVEDDEHVRRALREALQEYAADVSEAATAQEGLTIASRQALDAIILDLGLPDSSGLELCQSLRAFTQVPILVLSAMHDESTKVALLNAGADDYVTKPFSSPELVARIQAHVRRFSDRRDGISPVRLRLGDVELDLQQRVATRGGQALRLTPTEWTLLRVLVGQRGRTMTHRQLFLAVRNREYGDASLHLRVHLTHLRRKIEANPAEPRFIVTDPGVGYRFEPPGPDEAV
ncbi:MAG TPA: response regulator transcription factor [Gemmatimonas sp.]|uniref:response regulator transcription factor n=1 Tax=Gemmatimonas sp. TaxID=1962908 RepID=UPI002EDB2293